jgi:hypothetical protein
MSSFFGSGPRADVKVFTCASASGNNAAATITLTAVTGLRHLLVGIWWSYSATPTGGRLTTTGLQGDQVDMDIIAGGPGPIFAPPAVGQVGIDVAVTLAAGGSGVTGKVTIWYATVHPSDSVHL